MSTDQKQTEITFEVEGHVALITLNGPKKRNALSAQSRSSLLAALRRAMRDEPTVRVVLLTGAAGHFCAGADVSQFTRNTMARGRFNIAESAEIVREMMGGGKPVVCALEGTAYGMGLSLAAAADFVVVARDARLCPVFARIGLVPDTAIFWTLPRRVGAAKARQLLAQAREFDGAAALEMGFASRVAAPGEALKDARALASRLMLLAPELVALMKPALTFRCDTFESALQAEVDIQSSLHLQGAGMERFPERRTAPSDQCEGAAQ